MLRHRFLLTPFLVLCTAAVCATTGYAARASLDTGDDTDAAAQIRDLPARSVSEVVWLARCIYSESNRPHEQRLVGWVVRNRVETKFRGRTYREVVLTPRQFSAFNEPSPRRRKLLNLTLDSNSPGWQKALEIAYRVYTAPADERPFSIGTRHFYSPISRSADVPPRWTRDHDPLPSSSLGVLPHRFKFYAGIDQREHEQPSDRPPALTQAQLQSASTGAAENAATSRQSETSLEELRRSVRRRIFQGRVQRPRRPTVEKPSRPESQR